MSPSGGGFGSASESEDENTEAPRPDGAVCLPMFFLLRSRLRFSGREVIVVSPVFEQCELLGIGAALRLEDRLRVRKPFSCRSNHLAICSSDLSNDDDDDDDDDDESASYE